MYKIGEKIKIDESLCKELLLKNHVIACCVGDEAVVTHRGFVCYISGEAKNRLQKFVPKEDVSGIAYEDLADVLFEYLSESFIMVPRKPSTAMTPKYTKDEILNILIKFL